MKQTQAISHLLNHKKGFISNSYKSNCTSRSLLPLILRFQGLCEHSYSNRYSGGPQRPPIQTRKSVFTPRGHKAPYRYSKPNKRLYNLGKTCATKRVWPQICVQITSSHTTGLKTTHSRLPSHDDLVYAGTTQWLSAISINVPHTMALIL